MIIQKKIFLVNFLIAEKLNFKGFSQKVVKKPNAKRSVFYIYFSITTSSQYSDKTSSINSPRGGYSVDKIKRLL